MGNAHSSHPHDPLESAVTHPIAPVANEVDKVIFLHDILVQNWQKPRQHSKKNGSNRSNWLECWGLVCNTLRLT